MAWVYVSFIIGWIKTFAKVNDAIELPCDRFGEYQNVSWAKCTAGLDAEILASRKGNTVSVSNRAAGRHFKIIEETKLFIPDVLADDNGLYICYRESNATRHVTARWIVNVHEEITGRSIKWPCGLYFFTLLPFFNNPCNIIWQKIVIDIYAFSYERYISPYTLHNDIRFIVRLLSMEILPVLI